MVTNVKNVAMPIFARVENLFPEDALGVNMMKVLLHILMFE